MVVREKSTPMRLVSSFDCAEFSEYDKLFSCIICSNGVSRLKPTMSNSETPRFGT